MATGKDNKWLQIEVCRQFLRGSCSRKELECRFAHPPTSIDCSSGTVTACFDFLKNRCHRESCRYFHPPEHISTQLVTIGSTVKSSDLPFESAGAMGRIDRSDRVEVCREFRKNMCTRPARDCRYAHPPEHISVDSDYTVTVCMDFVKDKCDRPTCRYYHPLPHIMPRIKQQQQLGAGVPPAFGGLMEQILNVPRKRPSSTSADALSQEYRSGMPYGGPVAAAPVVPGGVAGVPGFAPVFDDAGMAAYSEAAQAQLMMAAVLQSMTPSSGQSAADPYAHYATAAAAAAAASAAVANASNPFSWLTPSSTGVPGQAAFVPERVPISGLYPAATSARGITAQSARGGGGDTIPICMDFKMGKCTRSSCRYAHQPEHVMVDNKTVRICRDFQRGKCQRSECRFYHAPPGV